MINSGSILDYSTIKSILIQILLNDSGMLGYIRYYLNPNPKFKFSWTQDAQSCVLYSYVYYTYDPKFTQKRW